MSNKHKQMTAKEYVENDGIVCPFCHTTDGVQAQGKAEVSGTTAFQSVECMEFLGGCGAEWTDEYVLSNYSPVE